MVVAEEVNARDAGYISEWGFSDTFVPQPQSSHCSPTQISEKVKGKVKIYVPLLLNNNFIRSNLKQTCVLKTDYLNVPNELLGGRFNGCLVVNDALNGRHPAHGFIQQLGVQTV